MFRRLRKRWIDRWHASEARRLKDAGREVCHVHPYLPAQFITGDIANGKKTHWCSDCFIKNYLR
jgi:hypothetical protein